eukprot:TRINITY_DN123279_c0_g1_i1.p1 TRINITY_DN123279_c0_g1~~TRINITY_DN123279_c0_g1_i1.p1  ORF type:complete len:318 (+),score=40.81 TRINITY_DN123279_c0_g1_i1:57-956(+)
MAFQWTPISRGDGMPPRAVKAGQTSKDGDVYVGRNAQGEVGKINLDHGKMWNLWVQGSGSCESCDVLVTGGPRVCRVVWKPYSKGEAIPEGAVLSGKTDADGDMIVARNNDGVPGKLNLSDGNFGSGLLHNLWVHDSGCHEEGEVLCVKPLPFSWVACSRGNPLPPNSVLCGRTKADGDLYIGRNSGQEVGKVNLDGGNMWNIWCHKGGGSQECEVLVLEGGATVEWKDYKKGDPIPDGAVFGGVTSDDGTGGVYVARTNDEHVPGKLNVDDKTDPPTAFNLWVQGVGECSEGQIMCVT